MTILAGTSFLLPGHAAWRRLGDEAAVEFADYGAWAAALATAPAERPVVLVLFLADLLGGAGEGEDALAPLLAALDRRLSQASAPTLVGFAVGEDGSALAGLRRPTVQDRAARLLADALYQRATKAAGLLVLPLDPLFGRIGTDRAYDMRNYYAARCRLSAAGLGLAAEAVAASLARAKTPPRKVLALDCDGTLWGGIVGEVGPGGILLGTDGMGQAFHDFQKAAKALAAQGVLLALLSKNNEAEVWEVFDTHPGMALQRSDIVAWRIDWAEKADNLVALAADLDLGLDAVVFWDDNPLERAKVQSLLPQVLTVEPPKDVTDWPRALARLDALARSEITDEDRAKTGQYQARAAFIGDKAKAAAEADFLSAIGMRATALALGAASLPRAAQLVAKTNQFNLRNLRLDAAALADFSKDERSVAFLVRLADRYGDHGLIGLALAHVTDMPGLAFLDNFVMSCRVLGRHVEAWALAQLVAGLRTRGGQLLVAEFVDSGRNTVAASFLPDHGFVAEDAWPSAWRALAAHLPPPPSDSVGPGTTRYALALDQAVIPFQEFFADADIA
ncbi:MAG TPA: HAD-IIIC family phosphatase [Stellaceae bacterium]|nr:HAD-IIIC family phosphatase [Stellaceae bacterium]